MLITILVLIAYVTLIFLMIGGFALMEEAEDRQEKIVEHLRNFPDCQCREHNKAKKWLK